MAVRRGRPQGAPPTKSRPTQTRNRDRDHVPLATGFAPVQAGQGRRNADAAIESGVSIRSQAPRTALCASGCRWSESFRGRGGAGARRGRLLSGLAMRRRCGTWSGAGSAGTAKPFLRCRSAIVLPTDAGCSGRRGHGLRPGPILPAKRGCPDPVAPDRRGQEFNPPWIRLCPGRRIPRPLSSKASRIARMTWKERLVSLGALWDFPGTFGHIKGHRRETTERPFPQVRG